MDDLVANSKSDCEILNTNEKTTNKNLQTIGFGYENRTSKNVFQITQDTYQSLLSSYKMVLTSQFISCILVKFHNRFFSYY